MSHPMMPVASHDERAEQMFVRDLKVYLAEEIEPHGQDLSRVVERRLGLDARAPAEVEQVRDRLLQHEPFRAWLSVRRTSQEMMWDAVGDSIDRQKGRLDEQGRIEHPRGSLRLDPDFKPPAYVVGQDVHLMPGGYALDDGGVAQGALIDAGGAVYMLGRNGGGMNDVRGHTAVAHLFDAYPDLEPKRILDMGCAVGASTVAIAGYFPDAEMHGIDVGASMLRYAHARAEHLGTAIHYSQQNAERTDFADASFDLVCSCVMIHETAPRALENIMAESHRLLRPGGVAIHLEVPNRYDDLDLWAKLRGEIETHYNNEPFWRGALQADFEALYRQAGFSDIRVGFQTATGKARRGGGGGTDKSLGVFRSWMVASARK